MKIIPPSVEYVVSFLTRREKNNHKKQYSTIFYMFYSVIITAYHTYYCHSIKKFLRKLKFSKNLSSKNVPMSNQIFHLCVLILLYIVFEYTIKRAHLIKNGNPTKRSYNMGVGRRQNPILYIYIKEMIG